MFECYALLASPTILSPFFLFHCCLYAFSFFNFIAVFMLLFFCFVFIASYPHLKGVVIYSVMFEHYGTSKIIVTYICIYTVQYTVSCNIVITAFCFCFFVHMYIPLLRLYVDIIRKTANIIMEKSL